jgi:hypothetical protein
MDDRRFFQRIPFQTVSKVTVRGKTVQGTLMDISMKGALVALPEDSLPSLGETASLDMYLPSSEITLRFAAEVVHLSGNETGLFFRQVDVDTLTHLRRLLELNSGDEGRVSEELTYWLKPKA